MRGSICLSVMFCLLLVPMVIASGQESKKPAKSLLKNHCFETCNKSGDVLFPGWKMVPIEASATLKSDTTTPPGRKSKVSALVDVEGLSTSGYACVIFEYVGNDDFALQKGKKYQLAFYAKSSGTINKVNIVVPKQEGTIMAESTVEGIGKEWKQFKTEFELKEDYQKSRIIFNISAVGRIWFDIVELTVK